MGVLSLLIVINLGISIYCQDPNVPDEILKDLTDYTVNYNLVDITKGNIDAVQEWSYNTLGYSKITSFSKNGPRKHLIHRKDTQSYYFISNGACTVLDEQGFFFRSQLSNFISLENWEVSSIVKGDEEASCLVNKWKSKYFCYTDAKKIALWSGKKYIPRYMEQSETYSIHITYFDKLDTKAFDMEFFNLPINAYCVTKKQTSLDLSLPTSFYVKSVKKTQTGNFDYEEIFFDEAHGIAIKESKTIFGDNSKKIYDFNTGNVYYIQNGGHYREAIQILENRQFESKYDAMNHFFEFKNVPTLYELPNRIQENTKMRQLVSRVKDESKKMNQITFLVHTQPSASNSSKFYTVPNYYIRYIWNGGETIDKPILEQHFYDFQSPEFASSSGLHSKYVLDTINPWDINMYEFDDMAAEDIRIHLSAINYEKLPGISVESYERGILNYLTNLVGEFILTTFGPKFSPLRLQLPKAFVHIDHILIGFSIMERDERLIYTMKRIENSKLKNAKLHAAVSDITMKNCQIYCLELLECAGVSYIKSTRECLIDTTPWDPKNLQNISGVISFIAPYQRNIMQESTANLLGALQDRIKEDSIIFDIPLGLLDPHLQMLKLNLTFQLKSIDELNWASYWDNILLRRCSQPNLLRFTQSANQLNINVTLVSENIIIPDDCAEQCLLDPYKVPCIGFMFDLRRKICYLELESYMNSSSKEGKKLPPHMEAYKIIKSYIPTFNKVAQVSKQSLRKFANVYKKTGLDQCSNMCLQEFSDECIGLFLCNSEDVGVNEVDCALVMQGQSFNDGYGEGKRQCDYWESDHFPGGKKLKPLIKKFNGVNSGMLAGVAVVMLIVGVGFTLGAFIVIKRKQNKTIMPFHWRSL